MRVAIIGDSHFDTSAGGRFEECCEMHLWIANRLPMQKPDAILHAGDVFERKSNPQERNAVAGFIQRCADVAPVVIVRGNHDAIRDLEIMAQLEARYPIIVEEAAGVHVLDTKSGPLAVACLAWPRKAEILARMSAEDGSHEQGEAVAQDLLRDVVRGLGAQLDGCGLMPKVLLSHAMVRAASTSRGQPLVGCDFELGLEDLALARAHFVALGHIHKPQDWTHDERPVVYTGSPRRTAYGETERKSYVMAEIGNDGGATWKRVEVPAQRMVLMEDEWGDFEDGQPGWIVGHIEGVDAQSSDEHAEQLRGADIRFRYTVNADRREPAAEAAAVMKRQLLEEQGAAVVKVDEIVRPVTAARSAEITAAKTLEEKLHTLWKVRQIDHGDRVPRIMDRLSELEAECGT